MKLHQYIEVFITAWSNRLDSMRRSSWHTDIVEYNILLRKLQQCGDEIASVYLNDHYSMFESSQQYEQIILAYWYGTVQHTVGKFLTVWCCNRDGIPKRSSQHVCIVSTVWADHLDILALNSAIYCWEVSNSMVVELQWHTEMIITACLNRCNSMRR
jgi:hypothetical protein